jgi:hypothetical protein
VLHRSSKTSVEHFACSTEHQNFHGTLDVHHRTSKLLWNTTRAPPKLLRKLDMNIIWNINAQFCPLLATNTCGHIRKAVSMSVLVKCSSYESDVKNEVFSTAKIITLTIFVFVPCINDD